MYSDSETFFIKVLTMQKIEEDNRYSNNRMRFILIMRRVTGGGYKVSHKK